MAINIREDYPGTQSEPFTLYFVVDERMPDPSVFTSSHITIQNGTLTNFTFLRQTDQTTVFQALVTPNTGDGTLTVSVAANVYKSNDATSVDIPFATTVHDVIEIKTVPTGTRVGPYTCFLLFKIAPKNSRRLFNQSAAAFRTYLGGFQESSIQLTNGTKSNYTGVITPPGSVFVDASVKFQITPPSTGSGNTTITIPANSLGDNEATTLTVAYTDSPADINTSSTSVTIPGRSTVNHPVNVTSSLGAGPALFAVTAFHFYYMASDRVSNGIRRINRLTGVEEHFTFSLGSENSIRGITAINHDVYIVSTFNYGGQGLGNGRFWKLSFDTTTNVATGQIWFLAHNLHPVYSAYRWNGIQFIGNYFLCYLARGAQFIDGNRVSNAASIIIRFYWSQVRTNPWSNANRKRGTILGSISASTISGSATGGTDLYGFGWSGRRAADVGTFYYNPARSPRRLSTATFSVATPVITFSSTIYPNNFGGVAPNMIAIAWYRGRDQLFGIDQVNRQIFEINTTTGIATPVTITQRFTTGDTVTALAFSTNNVYFSLLKTVSGTNYSAIYRFNRGYVYQDNRFQVGVAVHDFCLFGEVPYVLYRQGTTTALGRWDSTAITHLVNLPSTEQFVICFNNLLFTTDANSINFRCYSSSGVRLTQNDFSLESRTEPIGTIKSISSDDRGTIIAARRQTISSIYRYNTSGNLTETIPISVNPASLLVKALTVFETNIFIANETISGSTITLHQIIAAEAIEYIGLNKITVNNFDSINIADLFTNETTVFEGVGVLANLGHTFVNGVFTPKFINEIETFAQNEEIWMPVVAANQFTFIEQGIYFELRQKNVHPLWADEDTVIVRQPDVVDLGALVPNAVTITSRTALPAGITLVNKVLIVARNVADEETTYERTFRANNNAGHSDQTLNIRVLSRRADLETASHWQKALVERVFIDDIEITPDLAIGTNIEINTDSQFLNLQRITEATIKVNDPTGYYGKGSYTNFFVTHGLDISGFGAPVRIEYGYKTDQGIKIRRLFEGHILRVSLNPKLAETTMVIQEFNESIIQSRIVDFGPSKKILFSTVEDVEGVHGRYPLAAQYLPISDGSIAGRARNFAVLTPAPSGRLETEGELDWSRFILNNDVVETEGSLVPYPPIFSFKVAYKYILLEEALKKLLNFYGIYNYDLQIPSITSSRRVQQNLGSSAYLYENVLSFYTRDWTKRGTDTYFLLACPNASESDRIIRVTERGIRTLILIAQPSQSFMQMNFVDDDTLYVIGSEKSNTTDIPLGTFDSSESDNKTKIWKYVISTDTQTVAVASDHAQRPQIAVRYLLGRRTEGPFNAREYSLPDNRNSFIRYNNESYYKYATNTTFGVAKIANNGTITSVISQAADTYQNMSCFDFHIAGSLLYFAYNVGSATSSIMYVKEVNLTNNSMRTVYQATTDYTNTDFFAEVEEQVGGIYNGILEVFATSTQIYVVAQLQKELNNARSIDRNAGAILYRIPVTGATNPATNDGTKYQLKLYEYSQFASRSFTMFESKVTFFEGSPYIYRFEPINNLGETVIWRDRAGILWTDDNGTLTSLGTIWSEEQNNRLEGIYSAMATPMIVHNGDLFSQVAQSTFAIEDANNTITDSQQITYSRTIQPYIAELQTNGAALFDLLALIAQTTYSFITFTDNKFRLVSKLPVTGQFQSISGTTITFSSDSIIPVEGYVKIGNEYMRYNGKTDTTLLNVERSQLGTRQRIYTAGEEMFFFRWVLNANETPSKVISINVKNDYNFLANSINVQYGSNKVAHTEDLDSIRTHGRKDEEIGTILGDHQSAWAERLSEIYLSQLKDLNLEISVVTTPMFFLNIGDTILVQYPGRGELNILAKIASLSHTKTETSMLLKSIPNKLVSKTSTPFVYRPQTGIAFDPQTDYLFYGTRYARRFGRVQAEPSGEILQDPQRIDFVTAGGEHLIWESNFSVRGRNLYIKDTTRHHRTPLNYYVIGIWNIDNEVLVKQYLDIVPGRPHSNYAMIVDDDSNIYVGELLATQNVLRRVVPNANPSETNRMTIPGDYIILPGSRFIDELGFPVSVSGVRGLTWHNGYLYGVDTDSKIIIQMSVETITGTLNKRAVITGTVIRMPSDITSVGDIARGRNCWYVCGADGTRHPNGHEILWFWTIYD